MESNNRHLETDATLNLSRAIEPSLSINQPNLNINCPIIRTNCRTAATDTSTNENNLSVTDRFVGDVSVMNRSKQRKKKRPKNRNLERLANRSSEQNLPATNKQSRNVANPPRPWECENITFAEWFYRDMRGRRGRYCICRSRDSDSSMIVCHHCEEWYHWRCVGLTEDLVNSIEIYCCDQCGQTDPRSKIKFKAGLVPPPEFASISVVGCSQQTRDLQPIQNFTNSAVPDSLVESANNRSQPSSEQSSSKPRFKLLTQDLDPFEDLPVTKLTSYRIELTEVCKEDQLETGYSQDANNSLTTPTVEDESLMRSLTLNLHPQVTIVDRRPMLRKRRLDLLSVVREKQQPEPLIKPEEDCDGFCGLDNFIEIDCD